MRLKPNNQSGFTLIEVLVAIIILSMSTIASVNLIIYLNNFSLLNENYVIATNLAREGMEVVRNQRDTNWLKWSGSLRESWNNGLDGKFDIKGMPLDSQADDTNSYLYFVVDSKSPATSERDIQLWHDSASALTDDDIFANPPGGAGSEETHQLFYDPATGYGFDTGDPDQATTFYRIVEVTYYDNNIYVDGGDADDNPMNDGLEDDPIPPDNVGTDGGNTVENGNTMRVISKVGFEHNGRWRVIELETFLSDWFMRDTQDDTIS